ncbi:glycosyltransferase family 4 protein [Planctomonas sp. JC2975]|uniref:glycosyltransferase family 4 protein n=1 Tax=Planctomonas sp. JC2975 TaxID=2729626 RepID=UPI001474C6F9|nr:glycosyltransferase family 4 protein [Planctomonas sp. JC2975]NNC11864.1 glycosyltransferase family 4 protein [Planctomonas sp. JC2975]
MERRQLHVITPGDHFSPRTGSAIPTVVDGLAAATPPDALRPAVLVARGTYADRYDTAEVIEYRSVRHHRADRYLDAAMSRIALPRVMARREYAATVRDQRAWDPSVIIAHNAVQLVPDIDADRHLPVLYAHNDLLHTYSQRESRRVLGRVGAIVCVSAALADQMSDSLPAELRERIAVVHNGIDTGLFRPRDDLERRDELRVVFVGRVIPEKGPDVLLEALCRLQRTDVRATIVGTSGFSAEAPLSAYERSLRRLAEPLGDRVTMRPFSPRREIADLLREADVVVVPSRWLDPFALTVLEGMASGAAVIASDIGGIPEAAGSAGLLVPPDDPAALAEAITSLADDENLRRRLVSAGLEHARANTWTSVRARFDTVVERAMAGRP